MTFEDESRARDRLEDVLREDDNATLEQLDNGVWQLSYHGKKRVRMNIKGTRKEAEAELAKRVSMIVENPRRFDRGKSLQEKVNNQKTRFLTEDEIQSLLKECPSHLKEIVTFAINTGMRMGEISNLKHQEGKEQRGATDTGQ